MTNVIASNHKWCEEIASRLEKGLGKYFPMIKNKEDLNLDNLKSINPNYIFFPHWSYLIPKEIFENFRFLLLPVLFSFFLQELEGWIDITED